LAASAHAKRSWRLGSPARTHWLALLGLLCVYFVLAFWTATSEYIWSNEAWFASPALNLLRHGFLGTTILESKGTWLEGIDRHTYWMPPVHSLAQSLWYRCFGFSLLAMRSLSIVAGAVVLLAWYSILKRLGGSTGIALTAVAIAATDVRFLTFAQLGRPDALCAALGTLGLAVYLALREHSLERALLAGNALAALSCITHPCGELYAAGLLLFALYLDRSRIGWRGYALIAAPYCTALAAWGVYILQAPVDFAKQLFGNIGGIGTEFSGIQRLSGLTSPLIALKREYALRYGSMFGGYATNPADRIQLFALAIFTIGVAGCALTPSIRHHRGYRILLLLGAADFLTLGIVDAFKSSGYLIHTMPIAAALLAVYLHFLFSHSTAFRKLTLATVLVLFCAVQLHAIGRNLFLTPDRWDYENTLAFLHHAGAGPDTIAAGEFAFAFGFESGIVDDIRLGYFSGRRPHFIAANVIYDGWLHHSSALSPVVHDYMIRLLRDQYRVAFHNANYTVYQRITKDLP